MSQLLKILYDVAGIRTDYRQLHNDLLGFSRRRLIRLLKPADAGLLSARSAALAEVGARLSRARKELVSLGEADISIRRGREIQAALDDYAQALSVCIDLLAQVDAHLQNPQRNATVNPMLDLKAAYDDALQHQKRLGTRLTRIASSI